jgi:hypothetical protein
MIAFEHHNIDITFMTMKQLILDWGLMVDTFDHKTEGLFWKLQTAVVRAE